eukprot:m.157587 g.157587  ORF g.157587 m.157587 type:complete len:514 (-) comp23671_c0_seq1:77-1618(-)
MVQISGITVSSSTSGASRTRSRSVQEAGTVHTHSDCSGCQRPTNEMPELPEVEATRRLVDQVVGERVLSVTTRETGGGPRDGLFDDIIVAEGVTEAELASALLHRVVSGTGRKGKQMWIELSAAEPPPSSRRKGTATKGGTPRSRALIKTESGGDRQDPAAAPAAPLPADPTSGAGAGAGAAAPTTTHSLLIHLGMTGSLHVRGRAVDSIKYKSTPGSAADAEVWPPRFTKLLLTFASGAEIAFADPRRLGRLLLRDSPVTTSPIADLAPDPTHRNTALTVPFAVEVLGKTVANIKAVLLDQRRLCCGVGNWVCDDVLLEAQIHPETSCSTLSLGDVVRLVDALHHIVSTACRANADSAHFPRHWLFHARWRQGPRGQLKLDDGRVAMFSTVAGRTTVHIPSVQRKSGPPAVNLVKQTKPKAAAKTNQPTSTASPKKVARTAGRAGKLTKRKKSLQVNYAPKLAPSEGVAITPSRGSAASRKVKREPPAAASRAASATAGRKLRSSASVARAV